MKQLPVIAFLLLVSLLSHAYGGNVQETAFDTFLARFDYEVRADMKIDSKDLVVLLGTGKAVLVDVRFPEEVAAWRMGFAVTMPLNELPKRYPELPKDKIIVTACPHKERSAIAVAYLRSKGYNAKYLTDGLVGLAEYLRGERARDFIEEIGMKKNAPSGSVSTGK